MKKTLEQKAGFKNRHLEPLPKEPCNIKVLAYIGTPLEGEYVGRYRPSNDGRPSLGTVFCIDRNFMVRYFHAFESSNESFVYYQIL